MKIKRLLVSAIITMACIAGFSETVYADDPNVWGNSVTTAIYSGGFADVDSGAIVYLVDMDGYATKWTNSYVFTHGNLGSRIKSSLNKDVSMPRVEGIDKPKVIMDSAEWLPLFKVEDTCKPRDAELIAYFKGMNGTMSRAAYIIQNLWGADAAKAYQNGEVQLALEAVVSVRMGYTVGNLDPNVKGGSSTPPKSGVWTKEDLRAALKVISSGVLKYWDGLTIDQKMVAVDMALRKSSMVYSTEVIDIIDYIVSKANWTKEDKSDVKVSEDDIVKQMEKDGKMTGGSSSVSSDGSYPVLRYYTYGYEWIIGTPRNIQSYYVDEINGMHRNNKGMSSFGYSSYANASVAKNFIEHLGRIQGFAEDTYGVRCEVGFTDGKLNQSGNVKTSKGAVAGPFATSASNKYHNPYTWDAGWYAICEAVQLRNTVANLSFTNNAKYKGNISGTQDILNPHSSKGIMLVKATDEIPPEEPEVYDGNFVIHQSELIKKVDLFNDIHGNALVASTYKWKKPKQTFLCSDVIDKDDEKVIHGGLWCSLCNSHHEPNPSLCGYEAGQCERCGKLGSSGDVCYYEGYIDSGDKDGTCTDCGQKASADHSTCNPVYCIPHSHTCE